MLRPIDIFCQPLLTKKAHGAYNPLKMKTYNDVQLISRLRRMVKGSTYRKTAEKLGVTGGYVIDVVKGRRAMTETIASGLGFTESPTRPAPRKWVLK